MMVTFKILGRASKRVYTADLKPLICDISLTGLKALISLIYLKIYKVDPVSLALNPTSPTIVVLISTRSKMFHKL
jgi:hypothetical protein